MKIKEILANKHFKNKMKILELGKNLKFKSSLYKLKSRIGNKGRKKMNLRTE